MTVPVTIPINALPNQRVSVPLSGHQFNLDIVQRSTGLYMDITMDGNLLIAGVLCQDRSWIIRYQIYQAPGDFAFADQTGTDDPDYTGLGSRFILVYQEGQP